MRNIIIVQCMSTGINYVQDIIDRNCNPVILEVKPFDDTEEAREYQKEVEEEYKLIEADYDLIYEKDSYEETVEMVRKLDPLLIVPGTEDGVIVGLEHVVTDQTVVASRQGCLHTLVVGVDDCLRGERIGVLFQDVVT